MNYTAETNSNSAAVQAFLVKIKSEDANERIAAIKQAPEMGADAVLPLGEMMGGNNPAASKAAGEALLRIAHHSGRPGAARESKAVASRLLRLTEKDQPRGVRAGALHLLGFVAGDDHVDRIARLLSDTDVREEARQALQRIPGRKVDKALRQALRNSPGDFAPALELALKSRTVTRREVGIAEKASIR